MQKWFIHLNHLGDFSLAIISGVIYVHSISAGGQSQLLNRNYILLIICDTFAILAPKYSRGYFILQKPADDYVTDDYGLVFLCDERPLLAEFYYFSIFLPMSLYKPRW